ncbi:MAG: sucrase ferredoxin [Actinomycetia bacterium]|nr:sucrase ferredoxin [Actinomycetes bacterium]
MTFDRSADARLGPDTCSVGARARRDPLIGSAPPAAGWLIFEQPGPWPVKATSVFGALGPEMDRRTLAVQVRPMLVRRPGRADPARSAPHAWWFVDSVTQAWVRGTWRDEDDVRAALDLVDRRRAEATAQMTPADPMLLVCAHAKHDVCCAVRGRPIAGSLAEHWPEYVWECSHLGGDRFAGNVAILPASTFYGGLDETDCVQVIADDLAGAVSLDHYRGSGTDNSAAQAAVAGLLRHYGSRRLGDVTVSGQHVVTEGEWDVELSGRGELPAHTVLRVVRRWRKPEQLTCRGAGPVISAEYQVEVKGPHP